MKTATQTAAVAEPTPRRSLWEIGNDLAGVLAKIEGDEEIGEAVAVFLGALEGEESAKIDNYVNLIRRLESEAAGLQAEADRYKSSALARACAAVKLKALLKAHLEITGRKEIRTDTGRRVVVVNNGGQVPLIIDPAYPVAAVPVKLTKTKIEIDGAAVRAALEAGEELAFAKFGERSTNLQIR